jgi:broad specificity phosphatase PhoE
LEGLPLGPPPGRGQVAVTHAGVIKSVLHHVLEVPSERPYAFRIGLGCAIVLQKTKGYWELCEFWPNPAATARYLD